MNDDKAAHHDVSQALKRALAKAVAQTAEQANAQPQAQAQEQARPRVLSIRQPWVELILRGVKRVENRSWPTTYRGDLIIHAGGVQTTTRQYLRELDGEDTANEARAGERATTRPRVDIDVLPFGCLAGVVRVVDCVPLDELDGVNRERAAADAVHTLGDVNGRLASLAWVKSHAFTVGPYCWILDRPRRLPRPIPLKGRLRLFDLTADIHAAIAAQLGTEPAS